jgi:dihydropyrimidinase
MPLLIQNGEIVTADSRYRADIYAEHETITRIGTNLEAPPGADVLDASGKLVFPGFIDPHVHIYLPFMATFAKDTHETASIAALIGGTTTFIEMCCPSRTEDALAGYHLWKSKAEGKSACDYAFHMAVKQHAARSAHGVESGSTQFETRYICSCRSSFVSLAARICSFCYSV